MSEHSAEVAAGHGSTCECMFCIEYRRAVARNALIPPHARMVVTNPVLSAHARTPTCATKGCTRPGTDKPYDDLPAICAEHAAEGDARLLAAVRGVTGKNAKTGVDQ